MKRKITIMDANRKSGKLNLKHMKLKEGNYYTFRIANMDCEGHRKKSIKKVKKKLIKMHKYHALFENPSGLKNCHQYPELFRLLTGETIME